MNLEPLTEDDFLVGKPIFVKYCYPSSKYHGSILLATQKYQYSSWVSLDAPELTRPFGATMDWLERTDERKTHLTNLPANKYNTHVTFKDFSDVVIKVGDILFGEGQIIKIESIQPTFCYIKCLHNIKCPEENEKYHRVRVLDTYLIIEDPTMLLLKI